MTKPDEHQREKRAKAESAIHRFRQVTGWFTGQVAAGNRVALRITAEDLDELTDKWVLATYDADAEAPAGNEEMGS